MSLPHRKRFLQYTPQGYAFWDPKSEGSAFPYFPCTGNFDFLLKISPCMLALCCGAWGLFVFQTSPCVWALCCGVWGLWFFQTSSLCGGSVLWCVGTLIFSKFPPVRRSCAVWGLWFFQSSPCVGALCCGVWGLWFFQSSSMCGSCVVVCRDFEFFKVPCVCGPCAVLCVDPAFFQVPLCVKFSKVAHFLIVSKTHILGGGGIL